MKIDIEGESYNPFLRRKEVVASIDHTEKATPSKTDVQKYLVAHFKAPEDQVEVLDIMPKKGTSLSVSRAFIWDEKKIVKKESNEKKEETKEVNEEKK